MVEPGGRLQWIDPDVTPTGCGVLQSKAGGSVAFLKRGIEVLNLWGNALGRPLDASNHLPDIFREFGLRDIHLDVMSTDNDPTTRLDFTKELSLALRPLVCKKNETVQKFG